MILLYVNVWFDKIKLIKNLKTIIFLINITICHNYDLVWTNKVALLQIFRWVGADLIGLEINWLICSIQ